MAVIDLTDARTLVSLRTRVVIVHHLPGRIRLRARSYRRLDLPLPRLRRGALRTLQERLDFIRNVRVNAAAATAVIDYDPLRLPPAHWETLLRGDEADATDLLEQWLASYPSLLHELMTEE